jgi:hypothetical protein
MVAFQAQHFTAAELVQAAEALGPYCTAGGALYDKYGQIVYAQVMEVLRDKVNGLRCVGAETQLQPQQAPRPPAPSPSLDPCPLCPGAAVGRGAAVGIGAAVGLGRR